jgi:hypothetical protein
MSNYHTLTNPDIYTEPFSWNPDRWFGPDAERLDKYFTVFSGGSRACLGIWLTQAEMTLAMARLWRIWDGPGEEGGRGEAGGGRMRLFETDERDAMMAADYFIPIPWKGTKGIRVVLESYE